MPKAKKHSIKRRSKGKHSKTKRGGMESMNTTGFVPFYNTKTGKPKDTGKVAFLDPNKINTKLKPTLIIPTATIQEVEDVFAGPTPEEKLRLKKEQSIDEYNKLNENYNNVKYDEACTEAGCTIMGGRKSRRHRRKGRRSHKHF